jgi:hypothetical protein
LTILQLLILFHHQLTLLLRYPYLILKELLFVKYLLVTNLYHITQLLNLVIQGFGLLLIPHPQLRNFFLLVRQCVAETLDDGVGLFEDRDELIVGQALVLFGDAGLHPPKVVIAVVNQLAVAGAERQHLEHQVFIAPLVLLQHLDVLCLMHAPIVQHIQLLILSPDIFLRQFDSFF